MTIKTMTDSKEGRSCAGKETGSSIVTSAVSQLQTVLPGPENVDIDYLFGQNQPNTTMRGE